MSGQGRLRIGMVGYAFMGRAHSSAWRNVASVYDLEARPELVALCGRDPSATSRAAARLGWASYETDWRALVSRDDIDIVDVCTPGSTHADIAIAALEAGKHVLCEKPLANTVAEAEAMLDAARSAAERSGAKAMVGFNYRRVPAVALGAALVASGRLGALRHVRAVYLQDWLVDPEAPLTWRLERDQAGSGALGDLGAHIVDLAQHLSGARLVEVSALTETFHRTRPLAAGSAGLAGVSAGSGRGTVSVDDAALFLARLSNGAVGTFEATRNAAGHKNGLRIELDGDLASIAIDLERLNELELYETGDERTGGWRRVLVTEPGHPYLEGWWPPGHVLGWDDTFVHEVRDLVGAITSDTAPSPSFEDGLAVQKVLQAVEDSAKRRAWVPIVEKEER